MQVAPASATCMLAYLMQATFLDRGSLAFAFFCSSFPGHEVAHATVLFFNCHVNIEQHSLKLHGLAYFLLPSKQSTSRTIWYLSSYRTAMWSGSGVHVEIVRSRAAETEPPWQLVVNCVFELR